MATTARKTDRQADSGTWPLASLIPNPLNPRTVAPDDPDLDELTASIRELGLLQPIVITPGGLIIAGHRRAIACKRAGLDRAPVSIQDLDEAGQLAAMLAENLQRRALNPVETARGCQGLADRGVTPDEIGKRCGLGRQTVLNHLAITALPPTLQDKIARFEMPLGMAPHLARLPSDTHRLTLGVKAVNEGWTVGRLADHVTAALAPQRPAAPPRPSAVREAAPSRAGRPATAAMPPAATGGVRVGATGKQACLDLLCDLTTRLRREPELARDGDVFDWLRRLGDVVREARA